MTDDTQCSPLPRYCRRRMPPRLRSLDERTLNHICKGRQTERHTDRQRHRQTDRQRHRQTDTQIDRPDRQTERQTARQPDTQIDRHADRQKEG